MLNQQIVLASRPTGMAQAENFLLREAETPELGEGDVLVQNCYLSVDPYMLYRMYEGEGSYIPAFELNRPLQGHTVGVVVESRHPDYAEGDHVTGMLGWEQYTVAPQGNDLFDGRLHKVDPELAPLSAYLGLLGMPGQTAWTGLQLVNIKAGDTVFVDAASGAVGSAVGQIAKLLGCRVTGCAGSDDKVALLLDQYGFDAAFNYKVVDDLDKAIGAMCPDGIDLVFENVGGAIGHSALRHMAYGGRMTLCGTIAEYGQPELSPGPSLLEVLGQSLTIKAFIVFDHPELARAWIEQGSRWLAEGKISYQESVAEGLASAPRAFMEMMQGKNMGKQVVRI